MATKTISIMDDAYGLLVRNRMGNESFSEVIRRTFGKKKSIMEFAGAWKDIDDREIERMHEHVEGLRKRSTKEFLRSLK